MRSIERVNENFYPSLFWVVVQFVIPRSISDEESRKIPRCARNDKFKMTHYPILVIAFPQRFFRKLLIGLHYAPRVLVTDKPGSHAAARRTVLPDVQLRKSAGRTIGPGRHINRPGNRSGRRVISNPWDKRNDSSRHMVPLITRFILADTYCAPISAGYFVPRLFTAGRRARAFQRRFDVLDLWTICADTDS